jgi:hypothetical protein
LMRERDASAPCSSAFRSAPAKRGNHALSRSLSTHACACAPSQRAHLPRSF